MAEPTVLDVTTPAQWRDWLAEHGHLEREAWVLIPRAASGRAGMTHTEAVEEALCFGWIDGLTQRHDDSSRRQRFSPRSARSAWSTINRAAVERLTAAGRMTPAGQTVIDRAKADGMWLLLADAQAGIVPTDLQAALDAEPAAAAGWAAMAPSARRMILEGLARVKRAETRTRKISAAVDAAAGEPPATTRRTGADRPIS